MGQTGAFFFEPAVSRVFHVKCLVSNKLGSTEMTSLGRMFFLSFTSKMTSNNIEVKTFIISALTFVVGLAWNSAFQNLFQSITWIRNYGPWVYAILLTVVAMVAIRILTHIEKMSEGQWNPFTSSKMPPPVPKTPLRKGSELFRT